METRFPQDAEFERCPELFSGTHCVRADSFLVRGSGTEFAGGDAERIVGSVSVLPSPIGSHVRRLAISADSDAAWFVLHRNVAGHLAGCGVTQVVAVVREDQPDFRRLEAAGYRVGWLSWGARLELDGPLPGGAYAGLIAEQAAVGRAVVEVGSELYAAAYLLLAADIADFPVTPATPGPEYTAESFAARLGRCRSFAVLDGDACVALTVSEVDGDQAETDFTVVDAAHRGQGLAKLVKAVSIKTLTLEGVRGFGTGGAAVNAASLAMNKALGYVLDPLWRTYVLDIGPTTGQNDGGRL